MRIVFMGTPGFAVPSLEAVAAEHEVIAAYTRPDAPKGRGRTAGPSEVKAAAARLGIPVRQPQGFRDPAEVDALASLEPDAICVAAYGVILPGPVLDLPASGCVNVHASLLPRHRGAAPIERAILEGDEVAGVSIMRMEEGLDTGPVAASRTVRVGDLGVEELSNVLAALGASLLVEVLTGIADGSVVWMPQPSEGATYARKLAKEEVALDPSLSMEEAWRRVRASSRHAPSRAAIDGRGMVVARATRMSEAGVGAGRVYFGRDGLLLGFADGALRIDLMRPEGRGEMDGAAWARGARPGESASWEASG